MLTRLALGGDAERSSPTPSTWPCTRWPPMRVAGAQGRLEVDRVARLRGAPSVVRRSVSGTASNASTAPSIAVDREAAAVDGDRVADRGVARRSPARAQPQPAAAAPTTAPCSITMPVNIARRLLRPRALGHQQRIRADRAAAQLDARPVGQRGMPASPRARSARRRARAAPRTAPAGRPGRRQQRPGERGAALEQHRRDAGGGPARRAPRPASTASIASTPAAAERRRSRARPGRHTTATGPSPALRTSAESTGSRAAAVEHDPQRLALGRRARSRGRSASGRRRARCRCRPHGARPRPPLVHQRAALGRGDPARLAAGGGGAAVER